MKTKFVILFLSASVFIGNAQSKDSLSLIKNQDKISYKKFIVPVTLITAGALLLSTNLNRDLQSNANHFFGKNFHTNGDNFSPFVPIVQIYLGKSLGFKPKNDIQHQTINLVFANAIVGTVISVLKRAVGEERPDQSNRFSFPSGHTAIAFTNASLLFYEYKDSNLWYASSGFLFAAATGALRIANNKHYTSDVLAGAGIGMATGLIVSYWNPFQSMHFGKNKKTTAFVYPEIGNQIGVGAIVKLN